MKPCPDCGSHDHGPDLRRVYLCVCCWRPLDPQRDDHCLYGIGFAHYNCAMRA